MFEWIYQNPITWIPIGLGCVWIAAKLAASAWFSELSRHNRRLSKLFGERYEEAKQDEE